MCRFNAYFFALVLTVHADGLPPQEPPMHPPTDNVVVLVTNAPLASNDGLL
jgi:hypothetical protein